MIDDTNTAERQVMRLSELLAELRSLLSAGSEMVPPPVIFSVGDALEAVEAALRSLGPVGMVAPDETEPPKSSADARRRIDAVYAALLELAASVPAAARHESQLRSASSPPGSRLATSMKWGGSGPLRGSGRDGGRRGCGR